MQELVIKYRTYAKAMPPRPVKMVVGGYGGSTEKMVDGSQPQPWHCLPFVEGSTYGLELAYPYETECHVVNDQGRVRFDWDYGREPGGGLTGGEFRLFAPQYAAKYYLFNTRVDIQPPAGYVVRTEPHPRYFTDDTNSVPLAMIGHLQNEWYPRMLFVVFRAPLPGQRHVFRRGEPFVQLIFVPQHVTFKPTPLGPEEEAERRERERAIEVHRPAIADNRWRNPDGSEFNNHYKVLARAFARGGVESVDEAIREARELGHVPETRSAAECLEIARREVGSGKWETARENCRHALTTEPDNAEALSLVGLCYANLGDVVNGLKALARAVALQPTVARFHAHLGEWLARSGDFPQAIASYQWSLQLDPYDAGVRSGLGMTLALAGRIGEAVQACRAAAALDPASAEVQFRLGWALAGERRYDEARAAYEQALALDATYYPATRGLAQLPAGGAKNS